MGIPICMTALPPVDVNLVRQEIQAIVSERGGEFRAGTGQLSAEQRLVFGRSAGGIAIVYPKGFVDCDEASKRMSEAVKGAAFSFKLDNEDGTWAYKLFARGAEVDRFSPWEDQAGSPTAVVVQWRASAVRDLEKYYRPARERLCAEKAYPTDEATQCNEWQLLDLMKKLRILYPIDERGNALGAEYHFTWGK